MVLFENRASMTSHSANFFVGNKRSTIFIYVKGSRKLPVFMWACDVTWDSFIFRFVSNIILVEAFTSTVISEWTWREGNELVWGIYVCDVTKVIERGLCDICRVFVMFIKIPLFLQLLRILVLLKSFATVFCGLFLLDGWTLQCFWSTYWMPK